MERRVAMIRKWTCLLLSCLMVLAQPSLARNGHGERLVLVTDQASGISRLSASEIRRLFLGFPVNLAGKQLTAVINQSDTRLYEVFLQKVVFMSANVYELHLLSNVVQLGGQLPPTFKEQSLLADRLHKQPGAVSYMWQADLTAYPHLIAIGELWRHEAN